MNHSPTAEAETGFMGSETDALYQESLQHFQEGRWQKAIAGFEEVLRVRPDDPEARSFLDEARLKASLEQDRPTPKRVRFGGPLRRVVTILALASLVLVLVLGAQWAYNRFVKPATEAQETAARKTKQMDQALAYLANRKYPEAEQAFRDYLTEYPGDEKAQAGLVEAQKQIALGDKYVQVEQAIAQQNWEEARRLLADIASQDPGYRDISAKQSQVEKQLQLSTGFNKAEQAYRSSDWQEAIASYETLRDLNIDYQKQPVLEHLFASYVNLGQQRIETSKGSSEAVRTALELYERALTLKPQHSQVLSEMALASRYLDGQVLLAQGNLQAALEAFTWVYRQQPDYAGGNIVVLMQTAGGQAATPETTPTASPTALPAPQATPAPGATPFPPAMGGFLAECARSLLKGDQALKATNYAQAVQHYHEAAGMAIHGGLDSARWLFVAYTKLGSAYARAGNQTQAVEAIQTALSIITRSALAIPVESYERYIQQGDSYAQSKDYTRALAQYGLAVQVLGQKCSCGLEDWSILP